MWPDSLAVVGLDALGGSLAWRARVAGVSRVIGFSATPATAVRALKAGAITERGTSPAATVRGAQLVVLSGTPGQVVALLPGLVPHLAPDAFLTDLSGAKAQVLDTVRSAGLAGRYAGIHPLVAPSAADFSGARPDLFQGAITYVTAAPEGETARQTMRAFVSTVLDGEPVAIDAPTHDRQVAWTLELPRACARALAMALSAAGLRGASFDEAARVATALAHEDGGEWEARVLANPGEVAAALRALESEVARLRGALERGDAAALRDMCLAAETLSRTVAR